MLPLYDDNRLRFIPFQIVTVSLIVLCVAVFLVQRATASDATEGAMMLVGFGFVPGILTGAIELPPGLSHLPAWLTLVSYAFLHIDFWHLAGNMLFLWVFGDNVEDELGHSRFLLFYLLAGIAGALTHMVGSPASDLPVVGASGAISGVMAGYLVLHPNTKLWVLVLNRFPIKVPAWLAIGFWFLFQAVMSLSAGPEDSVSWLAHIGGFVAGIPLVLVLRRRTGEKIAEPSSL